MELLENAPLVEVICAVRFTPGEAWSAIVPGRLYERLMPRFPETRTGVGFEATFEATDGRLTHQATSIDNVQFWTVDGSAVVVVSPNELTINMLRPHPGWEEFKVIIGEIFSAYRQVAQPSGVVSLGLRYINRFDFENIRVKLEDHFQFYPFLGPTLPLDHGLFTSSVDFLQDNALDVLRLQLRNGAISPEEIQIILDLDYFSAVALPDTFWEVDDWLENAHATIKKTFHGSLTESALIRLGASSNA